jgi:hypothetical protein
MKRILALLLVVGLLALGATTALANDPVPLNPSHIGATNPGFGTGTCPAPPDGQEGWYGWHFIMPANNNFTSLSVTFQNAGTFSADPFPGTVFVAHPDNSHAYIWTPGPDTLLSGFATSDGSNSFFNLSHVCPGEGYEELTVSKTAVTSFTREHFWDIEKMVGTENGFTLGGFPKIWLYTDGSGDETATWTIDVTYEGYEDSDLNVSGEVTIENTGTLDAVITSVEDVLGGVPITVDFGVTFPYTLPAGETLTGTYSEDGYFEGKNEVTVTTERDTYFADAEIIWGDPTTEINATVNIKDYSYLFGKKNLGTVTAPNDDTFTYTKDFAWENYGQERCGSFTYGNTAKIVETGQSASATLKVNVQCLIFKGETAWAANGNTPGSLRYTPRGNWATYVKYEGVQKTTTLFAGQHIDVGSVTFSAPLNGHILVTINLTDGWEFENVAENVMIQDYASAPSGNPAPGLFAHKGSADPAQSSFSIPVPLNNFYGVHVNVGQWMPDPNFGP